MAHQETSRGTSSEGEAFSVLDLAERLADDDRRALRLMFEANGAKTPQLTWSPTHEDLSSPVLRSFADVCDALGTPGGGIPRKVFGLDAFDGLERWLMVLERTGDHFRYRHYGAEIREHYGTDMTGRSTKDFNSYIGNFFGALYHAVCTRGLRIMSEHEPPERIFVRSWRRLLVPLLSETGKVDGIVAANVPENELRAGLEMIVDPVFVAAGDGTVLYANSAAQRAFRITSSDRRSIDQVTGFDIGGTPPPEVLLTRREVIERLELISRPGGLMDRVTISISAAEHRRSVYYVVQVRQVEAD